MPQQREPKVKPLINLDVHSNKELKRAVLPRTIKGYNRTLVLFDEFLDLHPAACFPLDIRTYKGFLEYYARITRGRIKEKPVPETVEHFWRNFEAALAWLRDFIVPESMSITLREFIISDLTHLVGLPDAEMSRDGLSLNNLTILLSQLWCRDFKEYRGCYPDRTRVQYTAAILLYCFTLARAGEVHESTARRSTSRHKVPRGEDDGDDSDLQAKTMAACYKVKIQRSAPTGHILANIAKHFTLTIELVDGIPMLVLTYERKFVKGYWRMRNWERPVHAFYKVYKEDVPLFFNLILFMLPLFSADQAFSDYGSYTEILEELETIKRIDFEGRSNAVILTIYFRKDLLDTPVFRPSSELNCESSTRKAIGADLFSKEFAALGHRSGYAENVTTRACRQWALMETDKKYSQTARMKHASHTEARTFGRSYAHPVCEVDGPAVYLNIATCHEYIQNRRSMGIHYNPNLWQSLPAKSEFEFEEREDVRQKDKIYLSELKRQRELQSGTQAGSIHEQTLFYFRQRAMLQRDLLARILPKKVTVRSIEGLEAMKALEALCKQSNQVAYRSGLEPLNRECICGKPIESFRAHRRWLHIYRCYSRRISRLNNDKFAEFCFECGQCHLDDPDQLLRCDPIIFRNCPVKPGYCPFCLGNRRLGPARRMKQYLNTTQWYRHLGSHLTDDFLSDSFRCRHPACTEKYWSMKDLVCHLEDVHCCAPRRGQKRLFEEMSGVEEEM
ncbi:hypothetical protein BJX64DRAFT_299023 [Aspergillus heterothallicus]